MVSENEERGPLSALAGLVERARQVESIDVEVVDSEEPLRGIRGLIDRARREEEGDGGAALRRLEEQIEQARELPEKSAYRPAAGDPLQALRARMRGDIPEEQAVGAEQADNSVLDKGGDNSRQRRLGQALERSLRANPLPGRLRAEVAGRLAELMDDKATDGLEEIWNLVVFGESSLGTKDNEG